MNLAKISGYLDKYKLLSLVQRISIIPIIAIFFSVALISYISAYNIRSNIISEMQENGVFLSQQFSSRIGDRQAALEVLEEQLNDKIRTTSRIVIENEELLDNDKLLEIAKKMDVDELHWLNKNGEIIYSTVPGYLGWQTTVNHPLRVILAGEKELMESIRTDAKYGKLMKYGAVRAQDGSFVQVGLTAKRIEELSKRFTYQKLVESLALEKNIVYVGYVDKNYKIIAHSNEELRGKQLPKYEYLSNVIEDANYQTEQIIDENNKEIYDILFPIIVDGKTVGALQLGYSMENIKLAVAKNNLRISLWGIFLLILISLSLRKALKSQVVQPITELEADIKAISLENNINYRLPIIKNNPFISLRQIMNSNLDISQEYFSKMIASQDELYAANEELEALVEQLSASEIELHSQYQEIQSYAARMKTLKEKYTLALEITESVVWELNILEKSIKFSENFMKKLALDYEKIALEEFIDKFVWYEDQAILKNNLINRQNQGRQEVQIQFRVLDKAGAQHWYLMRGKGFADELACHLFITGVLIELSEYKRQEEFIRYLADHDQLTDLYNKRKFEEKLNQDLADARAGAILLIDIDNFKNVNDTLGHVYGDKVLKNIADLLMKIVGKKTAVYRFGGDEFLIRLVEQTGFVEVEQVITEINQAIKNNHKVEGINNHLTLSMGIVFYPLDGSSVDELLKKADIAMYSAKRAGKNRYGFFNESMNLAFSEKIKLEKILHKALEQEQFKVVYQPVVNSNTGEVAYFEALLRMSSVNISPAEFIPVAEETGLIVPIGQWVIIEVLKQLRTWLNQGLSPKPIAINLSARQFEDPLLVPFIEEQLLKYAITANLLEIEITESVLLENKEETMTTMQKIQALGINIALDDFGTGFSSLNYLTFIPVNKIKLDKSLKDKFINLENIQVMDSLIALAHGLHLEVVIEGVEELEELPKLKRAGSDYLQGYFFSRPIPASEAEQIFNKKYLN